MYNCSKVRYTKFHYDRWQWRTQDFLSEGPEQKFSCLMASRVRKKLTSIKLFTMLQARIGTQREASGFCIANPGPAGWIRARKTNQGPAGLIRAPQDGLGSRRTYQGPEGRTRAPQDESGPRRTNQGPMGHSGVLVGHLAHQLTC